MDQLLQFVRSEKFTARVCADSRAVEPGDIFVAVVGTNADGHKFIPTVINQSPSFIVCQNKLDVDFDNFVEVKNTSVALGILAQAAAGDPAKKLINLAVTGTNGKTTVAYITRSIIKAAGHKAGLIGTIEYDTASDSSQAQAAPLTTPDSVTIANLMSQMVVAGARYMVTEASSHALSQSRLAGIDFTAAAFTNLTGDHLDYHKTEEQYLAEKTKLFTGLSPDSTAVLNKQSKHAHLIAEKTQAKLLWYAVDEPADISAKTLCVNAARTIYELSYNDQSRQITSPLIGTHNVSNQLAAAGLCFAAGFDIDQVADGIQQTVCVPGRLEPVPQTTEFALLIDYAHTDDALKNVLQTLKPLSKNNLIVLFGCGGDRDKTKRPRMAEVAMQYADKIIVTSDNPRTESPQAIVDDILKGFAYPDAENIYVEVDRTKAIKLAIDIAQKDDIVLLAGKGHETYQIIGTDKIDFDEKQIAAEFIERKKC